MDWAEFKAIRVFFSEIDFNSFLPLMQAKATLKYPSATTFAIPRWNFLRQGRLSYCQH